MKASKILWILAFVCLIDSIGFGIMIPLIYSYGKKFGLNKETLGLLTAAYSLAQFFATPILGGMSDKIGRKLLLVICLFGTCLSFVLFGMAGSLTMLFLARILDGLTGGDISVAQAMVADISPSSERAKNFGILGSAFGLGYVIGPAIGGLLSGFGITVPFFFAAALSLTGALLSLIFLKETHPKKNTKQARFIYRSLFTIFKRPVAGPAVLTGFLLTTAQFVMLIGFQTFSSDKLKLTPTQTGLFYGGFGLTGILMQMGVPLINKWISSRALILLGSTICCAAAMLFSGLATGMISFAIGIGAYGFFNGLRNPMLNAIIADHSKVSEQGEIMGINQSYTSIGQAVGPAIAGLAAAISLQMPFFLAGVLILAGLAASIRLKHRATE
ncbi:MFS transporter [Mucilaginibacter corticis]|uniref:MFS transporter n=1 Tax=Mucilaginibacter corticis TaxID=2597670 RepID=A0A556M8X7_9SPHI|nr:MFS transporter [Mucilaginibacter corticis]TSJ36343.1 MFS transporter [Mucilaginibacter corticis]